MSSMAVTSITGSKPKIHRLPALPPRAAKVRQFGVKSLMALGLGALLALSSLAIIKVNSLPWFKSGPHVTVASGQTPAIAVKANSEALVSKDPNSIVLTGDGGMIIGEIAHVPAKPEQMAEVHIVSDVDNRAGRDLLTILNNY